MMTKCSSPANGWARCEIWGEQHGGLAPTAAWIFAEWHANSSGACPSDREARAASFQCPVVEDFERLQWRVMRDVEGLRHAQLYGDRGQAQFGLDIVALAPDGSGVALPSKRYIRFGAAEVKTAVKKFRTTERPFSVDRLIIGVARTVRSTGAVEELAVQRR